MSQSIVTWSHPTWNFIHCLPHCSGSNARDRIATVFCQLVTIIPCPHCRKHAVQWIKAHPPYDVPYSEMAKYFFDFHNSVNRRLKKPSASRNILGLYTQSPAYVFGAMQEGLLAFSTNNVRVRSVLESIVGFL